MSFTTTYGYLHRYFTRWVTELSGTNLQAIAWDVCDRRKFDNIAIARFDTQVEAEAMCKLLNSIEEETNGVSE